MYRKIIEKKLELDRYRPLPNDLINNLGDWFKVELTYSSNAIEGNTLTRRETALVVEKGLTVAGKSLNEHLEANNHAKAIDYIKELSSTPSTPIKENHILTIHRLILEGIDTTNAGRYRSIPVRISGSRVILPNYMKVPTLMKRFIPSLQSSDLHPVELATFAHYQLVSIHPFSDGNGRTARLLMNLILLQNGYPPAIINKRQRESYIASLEHAQLGGSRNAFDQLIAKAVERSLDIYLKTLKGEDKPTTISSNLLKIGQLAKLTKQTVPTLRFWTSKELLEIADKTAKGYSLYHPDQVERVNRILELKNDRLTLEEIRTLLDKD